MRRNRADGLRIGIVIAKLFFFRRFLALASPWKSRCPAPTGWRAVSPAARPFRQIARTKISRAPSSAAFASGTLMASTPSAGRPTFTYLAASCSGSSVGSASSASANGSSPASRAICALVRRLGLYGRYMSSSALLRLGRFDRSAPKLVGQFALLLDRRQNRHAPLFQFAQIQQPFFQLTQLGIVQIAGRLLAIARDEGHGRALRRAAPPPPRPAAARLRVQWRYVEKL